MTIQRPGSEAFPTEDPDLPLGHDLPTGGGLEGFPEGLAAAVEPVPMAMRHWDRYEVTAFLGQGGMARVYQARDPRLNRMVALKFIREENPVLARRLTLEAQLQASLAHDNIVKVYETGEFQGRPYIAMQLVAGCTLDQLGAVGLKERVGLLAEVGRALDAAHCQGMVHRDLKPSNIMVETTGPRLKPYLMDFGLARLTNVAGATLATSVMGTLAYMAPEQAEGNRPLDIRTDVHAMGAILYELLTGHPPFAPQKTTAHGEIVRRLLLEEAVPPSHLDPKVPRDLETIALRCLEKNPDHRYATAAAVAEELERWLQGRPIQARPAGLLERTLKAARRLRGNAQAWRITQVAAATLLVLLGTGAWQLWRARRRAEFVAESGLLLAKVEDLLRTSAMGPLHDLRPDHLRVERLLAEIQHQAAAYGGLADAPLAYALGRSHLALHQYSEAQEDLQRAWNLGFRNPAVAESLGRALGEVYRLRLRDLERETDPQRRKDLEAGLRKTLQEPALAYLARTPGGSAEDQEYRAALADGIAGRHQELLVRAEALLKADPLALRYLKLKAAAEEGLALQAEDAGDHVQAMARVRAAGAVVRQGLEVARSDRAGWLDLAEVGESLIYQSHFLKADPQEGYLLGLEACAKARLLDPGDPEPLHRQAMLLRSLARGKEAVGEDPSGLFREGVALMEQAIRMQPANPDLWRETGLLDWSLATDALQHRRPSADLLAKAGEELRHCLQLRPGDVTAISLLLDVIFDQCQDRQQRGEDILPTLDQAAELFVRARALDPSNYRIQSLGVIIGIQRGLTRAERGQDPLPDFGQALAVAEGILALRPQAPTALVNQCMVLRLRAQHRWRLGAPFEADLEAAIAAGRKVLAIRVGLEPLINLGQALGLKGDYQGRSGQDPREAVREGLALLDQAAALDPKYPDILTDRIDLRLVQAAWLLKSAQSAAAPLKAARQDLDRIRRLAADQPDLPWSQARILELEAAEARRAGAPGASLLRQAAASLDPRGAVPLNPERQALRASLLRQLADTLAPGAGAASLREEARTLGAEALRRNPFMKREYGAAIVR
jgi:serine/threonine-protein kinase